MDAEVLIVGAGPTGLMLANQLLRRGVRALIIDRHAGPSRETRALGVQARSLEIYAQLGIIDRALELGTPGRGAYLWARGRRVAHVSIGETGKDLTPYPYILILGQDANERIMGDKLRDSGLSVQWNTELVGLAQHAGQVAFTLRDADGGTRKLAAAWVAGCDGAHSAVRELNGIAFPGAPYEHVFFVADVEVRGSMMPGEVNVYLWRDGFHLFFPMRGQDHWRIVGILPPALRRRQDVGFDAVIPSVRGEAGTSLEFKSCAWFSTYRIHHRAASRFRAGRCFVLGDAAHIHSPVGAQGMNTGLQDAYNLAWKLALVVTGQAEEKLLDTYESERLPIARQLLATTDRGFKLAVSDSWIAGLFRTEVVARIAAFAMRRERFQRAAFRLVSQTGIRYRDSVLSQNLTPPANAAPRAGDRFPWLRLKLDPRGAVEDLFQMLDDTRFNLLAFGQTFEADAGALPGRVVQCLVIPADTANDPPLQRAGIAQPSFYLLRPDGYVGLCGGRVDLAEIERYLRTRIGATVMRPSTITRPAPRAG